MNLEVAKWYVDGEDVRWFIGMRVPNSHSMYHEFYGHNEKGFVRSWNKDGRYGAHSKMDLIREWREPRSITVDVYMVEESGILYSSTWPIGHRPSYGIIRGVRRITINEGDGMEEQSDAATSGADR